MLRAEPTQRNWFRWIMITFFFFHIFPSQKEITVTFTWCHQRKNIYIKIILTNYFSSLAHQLITAGSLWSFSWDLKKKGEIFRKLTYNGETQFLIYIFFRPQDIRQNRETAVFFYSLGTSRHEARYLINLSTGMAPIVFNANGGKRELLTYQMEKKTNASNVHPQSEKLTCTSFVIQSRQNCDFSVFVLHCDESLTRRVFKPKRFSVGLNCKVGWERDREHKITIPMTVRVGTSR